MATKEKTIPGAVYIGASQISMPSTRPSVSVSLLLSSRNAISAELVRLYIGSRLVAMRWTPQKMCQVFPNATTICDD